MPTLVPCLVQLRDEFNRINPNRDKASDGWIGDPAHQASKSDHNPDSRGLVHAIDVDETGPWDGETMMQKVERLRLRCKSGQETRLAYIIYERSIASPVQDWGWRAYSGANPHDKHAHFSASYTPAKERDTSTWGVAKPLPPKEPTVAVTETEQNAIRDKVWAKTMQIPGTTGTAGQRTAQQLLEYLGSSASTAALVDSLVDEEGIPAAVKVVLQDWMDTVDGRLETISDRLNAIMSDPADYPGGPEAHPFVMAFRHVNANPPAGA